MPMFDSWTEEEFEEAKKPGGFFDQMIEEEKMEYEKEIEQGMCKYGMTREEYLEFRKSESDKYWKNFFDGTFIDE